MHTQYKKMYIVTSETKCWAGGVEILYTIKIILKQTYLEDVSSKPHGNHKIKRDTQDKEKETKVHPLANHKFTKKYSKRRKKNKGTTKKSRKQ